MGLALKLIHTRFFLHFGPPNEPCPLYDQGEGGDGDDPQHCAEQAAKQERAYLVIISAIRH